MHKMKQGGVIDSAPDFSEIAFLSRGFPGAIEQTIDGLLKSRVVLVASMKLDEPCSASGMQHQADAVARGGFRSTNRIKHGIRTSCKCFAPPLGIQYARRDQANDAFVQGQCFHLQCPDECIQGCPLLAG